eukprot:7690540-Lingulodinium_polyedra.AAC.1
MRLPGPVALCDSRGASLGAQIARKISINKQMRFNALKLATRPTDHTNMGGRPHIADQPVKLTAAHRA